MAIHAPSARQGPKLRKINFDGEVTESSGPAHYFTTEDFILLSVAKRCYVSLHRVVQRFVSCGDVINLPKSKILQLRTSRKIPMIVYVQQNWNAPLAQMGTYYAK